MDSQRHVSIRMLGGFSVSIDGDRFSADRFDRPSGAHLVQYLALAPGRSRHREHVMNDLWPEADPELATRRLYKALTHQEIATNPDVEAGTIRAGALVTGLNQARSSGVDDAPLLAELRRLARSGACTSEANLHMALGLHHRESDPVASQRGFERAVEIADQHRLIFTAIAARCGLASVLLDRGINEGSLRSLREALEWVQGQGSGLVHPRR